MKTTDTLTVSQVLKNHANVESTLVKDLAEIIRKANGDPIFQIMIRVKETIDADLPDNDADTRFFTEPHTVDSLYHSTHYRSMKVGASYKSIASSFVSRLSEDIEKLLEEYVEIFPIEE